MTTVLIIVLVIAIVIVIALIASKNSINTSSNQVDEAYSTMDVYLKQRHDLIPNLVNTAKGYAKYEADTLDKIAKASSLANTASSTQEIFNQEQKLDGATNKLIALAQAYPDLKANDNYTNLMNQLQKVEADIANARKYYNASVREYNNKLTTFPTSMFAQGLDKKPYFQVTSEAERQNVDVNF